MTVAAVKDLAAAGCSNHAPSPIMLTSAKQAWRSRKTKQNSAVGSEEGRQVRAGNKPISHLAGAPSSIVNGKLHFRGTICLTGHRGALQNLYGQCQSD